MSNKKSTARRGPSRPVTARSTSRTYQARYAPAPRRRGLNPFALGFIVALAVVLVGVVAFLALVNHNTPNSLPATTAGNTLSAADQAATSTTIANLSSGPTATAAEIAFQTQVADVPRVTVQQAKQLVDAGAKIIDVRPATNYETEHVAGAVNIPQAEVTAHLSEIPKTGTVIMYCDCPNDEESAATAKSLRNAGYTNVEVMHGPQAFSQWKQAGFPTATGK